jgi:uncharacterized damage-inducible protein DinB
VTGQPTARSAAVTVPQDPAERIVAAWRTNDKATTYLIEHLPAAIWSSDVPGVPRRTVGMIAAHVHNCRCSWIKALGGSHGVRVPAPVDPRRVRPRELLRALSRSSESMVQLIGLGAARGGAIPRATWQNFPTDLEHFLCYFVAHEAHHRGQLCLIARQLGHRLPRDVAGGVWQWTKFSREHAPRKRAGPAT